jgi:RNA polymerase sigma-70 factor (ECF subfamily)
MMSDCDPNQVQLTAETVARHSRGKLVAYLAARWGDLESAEDALSEAFATALATWPRDGCPNNPEAWLLTVARRKLIDSHRGRREDAATDELEQAAGALETAVAEELPDRRLALLFACAHPAIDPAMRAPLMLQVILGLDAAQIASAFLVSPSAMAQRLVRAKAKIRESGIPFRIPTIAEMPERLAAVLDAVYACFAEGWLDAAGTDVARRELAGEAIFLARLLSTLLPGEPESLGLLALMLYAEARRPARRGPAGEFVPLAQQDTALWDAGMIEEAEGALRRASRTGQIGRYQLEAAIQSAHVERRRTGAVNWSAIVALYDALVAITQSPVAEINRAIAVSELEGAAAGLEALSAIEDDARLRAYQPFWAARAELLARIGRPAEAAHAFEIAAGMESDPAVRQYLEQKRAKLAL